MTALEQNLAGYLQLRHSLGHQLAEARWLLPGFVAYLGACGLPTVTIEAALAWAQQAPASPQGRVTTIGARRMTAARGFARYLSGIDPATQVPPPGLMPHRARWRQPFIYTTADISTLLETARNPIASPLRAATYQTLIGLLASSGLRIGEAIKLDRTDIDWAQGVLLIRESKFGKSRLVPLQPTSMQALGCYARLRDELQPHPAEPAFLVSLRRKRLLYAVVQGAFRQLIDTAGIGADAPSPPRLHDLSSRLGCPMRPVCMSRAKIRPPSRCTASVTIFHASTCSADCRPGCWCSPGRQPRAESQRQTDIARLLDADAATMTRTIQRLEQGAFVRRIHSEADKRVTIVEATTASRALREEVERARAELEHGVTQDLTAKEQSAALDLLGRMEASLSEIVARGR